MSKEGDNTLRVETITVRTLFQFGWADNFANSEDDNDDWAIEFARAGRLFDEWSESNAPD